MTFNLDIAIVIAFLIINLAAGVYSGRGIKNITEYAVGNRKFATSTLAATIIATWISGSFFTVSVSQSYKEGIWFIPAAVGDILSLIIIARFLAPKMQEFFGHLSVAESMGALYGKNIRLVTAIASLAQSIAMTALQIQVFSTLFSHFLNFPTTTAVLISSFVVIFYSAWGGIKSVTFTDVIQFFTFSTFIPMFALFIWQALSNHDAMIQTLKTHPLLDYTQLLNYKDARFFPNFFMMLWFLIPSMSSTTFQRALMAKNTNQITASFSIAAIGYGALLMLTCIIGLLILSINHTLNPNDIVISYMKYGYYIIDNYAFIGLKGLTVIGIMAMVMSTADSWINTGAVIFSHDLCKPFGIQPKNELLISRLFSVFVGFVSVIMVLSTSSLFKLFSLQANFYMPIVTMPLLLAILGFRSTSKAVGIGMISGAVGAILWKIYLTPLTAIDSVVPAMLINLLTFVSAHYILGQPGGWIKTEKKTKNINPSLGSRFIAMFAGIYKIDMLAYCNKKLPKQEIVYSYFALAVALTIIISLTIDPEVYRPNSKVIHILQAIALFISTFFLGHKLWSKTFHAKYSGLIWYVSIFIGLAFNSIFLVLLSNFSQPALVIFVLNLSVIGILVSWRTTIIMILGGALSALCIDNLLIGGYTAIDKYDLSHIAYALFMVITFILMFLKPKEEEIELAEEKIDHLSDRVDFQNQEIDKLTELKYEFLRNIEHEAKTPITGITNLAELLWLEYDNISEPEKRKTMQMIAISAERLKSFISNFIDLSQLSSLTYEVNIKQINLSNLLQARFEICRKLYIEEKNHDNVIFELNIDDNIIIKGDEYLLSRVIDNLIINSIKYCPKGLVNIALKKGKNIEFTISDQGIGIPADELSKVFGVMVVSSRTKTPAGGRGVGLALCKKIIELHKGTIWAEGNGSSKGVTFKFVIPS
jgi:Na+/proline symporter/signal transduction histidine kinase